MQHVLTQVDEFARDLHQTLAARNLTDIVDIIFVSDHGMVDTSNVRLVYLDDILGEDGMEAIKHEDGEAVSIIGSYSWN
jgi:predicted AlkP superfamily pyrophosphatase or phosphodiesterase